MKGGDYISMEMRTLMGPLPGPQIMSECGTEVE
jgi:hypothetical protein